MCSLCEERTVYTKPFGYPVSAHFIKTVAVKTTNLLGLYCGRCCVYTHRDCTKAILYSFTKLHRSLIPFMLAQLSPIAPASHHMHKLGKYQGEMDEKGKKLKYTERYQNRIKK